MPLARLHSPSQHQDWIFDPKLDGFRAVLELAFVDLAAKYGFRESQEHAVSWSLYDNATDRATPVARIAGLQFLGEVRKVLLKQYASVTIRYEQPASWAQSLSTKVLRRDQAGWTVVGVERTW
jgi:hypothetical protein